jgi:glutaredoxin
MYIVYGKKQCAYCERAVTLLRSRGFDFTYHSMDAKLPQLMELSTIYNWRTVPLIIKIEGKEEHFVGGYDDLVKTIENKVLEENNQSAD